MRMRRAVRRPFTWRRRPAPALAAASRATTDADCPPTPPLRRPLSRSRPAPTFAADDLASSVAKSPRPVLVRTPTPTTASARIEP